MGYYLEPIPADDPRLWAVYVDDLVGWVHYDACRTVWRYSRSDRLGWHDAGDSLLGAVDALIADVATGGGSDVPIVRELARNHALLEVETSCAGC